MSDDPGFRVELDLSHFTLKGDLPARGLLKAARRGMLRAADILRASVANKAANGPLHRRTGMLARTFRVKEVDVGGGVGLGIVNDASGETSPAGVTFKGRTPYANILEKGGTIKPIKAKALAIPMGPALTGAGVPKYKSPRDVPGLFVWKNKAESGLAFLAKSVGKGKNAKIQLWFMLVKESKIPAFHYIEQGFTEGKPKAIDQVNREVNSFINKEIVSGLKG